MVMVLMIGVEMGVEMLVVMVALCRFTRTGGEAGDRGEALWSSVGGGECDSGDGWW